MGYYIEVPQHRNKADQLVKIHGATIVTCPSSFEEIPQKKAIICVVDNIMFEAAAYCYSSQEFEYFREPDGRPRQWLTMDKKLAEKLTGF